MPDKDAGTPRVFLVRHGETEWTISGKYTGSSDIPLTANGESQVLSTASSIIGPTKIISASNLAKVYISPRTRARRTFDLLFDGQGKDELLNDSASAAGSRVVTEQRVREWEYGDYEGRLTAEIRALRKSQGLDTERPWNIWVDGCANGESAEELAARLDSVIQEIRAFQGSFLDGGMAAGPRDVLVVAHGHSLRAFAKRWIGFEMSARLPLMLEPGAVGILSYEHGKVAEPALLLGVNLGGASH